MLDFTKTEIEVHNQEELDSIPVDYHGRIYVNFGSPNNRAVVSKEYNNASVEARENASVEARENASVVALENASVEARENASVEALENASVVALENASVVACGFSTIVRHSSSTKISTFDKARCINTTKDINTFMLYHGIRHTKTKSIWYKAVHKYASDGSYHAEHDPNFTYEIGRTAEVDDVNLSTMDDCGRGLHIASLSWAIDFGEDWENLAILEVEVKTSDIVLPISSDGKVRVPKLKVLREVPLEECGLYGKILAKKRGKYND